MPTFYKRRPPKVTVIRYSCTTGKPVWLYRGQSVEGMRKMYQRARRKEIALERRYPRMMKRRAQSIRRFLDECIAALPILGELTEAQRKAIRTLRRIANEAPKYASGFYNHVRTERRRRKRDSEIRRKMREREAQERAEREAQKQAQQQTQQQAGQQARGEARQNDDNSYYDK